ncbi:MAG TPA: hypothetical protein VIC26_12390 [Marinagarivorans sp.]
MKLSEAIQKSENKHWLSASIRKNPSLTSEWFVMLIDGDQRPHMLVDDHENPIVNDDLNYFVELLKAIGLREFSVFL